MMSDENNLNGALTLLSLHRGLRARVYFRVQESAGDSSISARRELRPESARDGRRNETMYEPCGLEPTGQCLPL